MDERNVGGEPLREKRRGRRPVWAGAGRRLARWWRAARRTGAGHRLRAYWPPPWPHAVAALLVVFGATWLLWHTCGLQGCPNVEVLNAWQPGSGPLLLDREGGEITRLAPGPRNVVALEDLPPEVPAAFLAVEDRRFHEHGGVDLRRVVGSALANVRAGGVSQGGSTITMQLARNAFPDRLPAQQRTMRRKLAEVRVAREIEAHFSKEEILELYLNHIYFGGAIYGIEAAANHYFGTSASALELAQAATLAAMPKAPNRYDPRAHPERALERRNLVLTLMARQGRIDTAAADAAQDRPLETGRERPAPEPAPPAAPYFVHTVRRLLEEQLGDGLYTQPLRIRTTLDPRAQAAAESALLRQLRRVEGGWYGRYQGALRYGQEGGVEAGGTRYLQGAVVVLDADSGDVLALVGGRDYADSPFDRATRAWRQAGSAFKPFVYAAALAKGYAPSQHLVDEPLEMELPGGEIWTPRNFGGGYRGEVTLRDAAVQSNNVATVRLAMAVGLDEVVDQARDAGIQSRLPMLPSLALGTAGVTLLELTAAYAPFANLGATVTPRLVMSVEDTAGNVVWAPEVERRESLDPGVAYLVTDLLSDAVARGTGHGVVDAGFRARAAGKTGTTDEGHDSWFIGYTPRRVAGVWIGLDRPGPVVERASGGRLAAPVWARVMRDVGGADGGEWKRPESVVEREVDPASGLILAEGCRPERGEPVSELFLRSELPSEVCPEGGQAEKGLLGRIADRARSLFGAVGGWVAGLFGGDEADQLEQDRYLGKRRLPRATQTPRVQEPDTTTVAPPEGPIGIPLDSLPPGWGEVPVELPSEPPDTL